MGRFDALTQIEDKPKKITSSQEGSSPTPLGNTFDREDFKPTEKTPLAHRSTKEVKRDSRTDVTTSSLHDVNLRGWRDTIENTETHNSSLRMTTDEGDNIEDVIQELKRKLKVKTSLNEVARLGLLYVVDDFKKNREGIVNLMDRSLK